ncbi:hypothetical protein [Saccharopolyspora pogona]|uniref:hypothetical protein n=1 Tax=Saccharopolyspora pogona TaxID=333966 RepID=UPI00168246EE|nr:hypothetical protein [Saccharopolyspora pogona]
MSRRFREPEPQHVTANGWAAARIRDRHSQHGYLLMYRGQYIGWLMRQSDGWRWLLTWRPGTASMPPQFGVERVSRQQYETWQVAASYLARTDVARRIAGVGCRPVEWHPVSETPWMPRPETRAVESSGRVS